MAKFVYKMENILNLKTKLEDEARIQLTLANNLLKAEQQKLEVIYEDIVSYEERIRGFSGGVLDVLELKRCNDAIAVKKIEAQEQKKEIEKAQRNADRAMLRLRELMVERKTQETLKARALEEFKKELNEEEKKEVDQIVSYQYNANAEEGDL